MGLSSGGLVIGRIFASEIWGAYFQEGLCLGGGALLSEFYGILKQNLKYLKVTIFGDILFSDCAQNAYLSTRLNLKRVRKLTKVVKIL